MQNETWNHLQRNGLESYLNDPEHNLCVGNRADCLEFSRFCKFNGLVLDVGCGPQEIPSYIPSSGFVGIDPIAESHSFAFAQAIGEFLPFKDKVFDHVVFATSLDHCIDPKQAMMEAKRVSRGKINIWIGERRDDVPRLALAPEWYTKLERPEGAEDKFHMKRFSPSDIREIVNEAGLRIIEERIYQDEFRIHYFYTVAENGT